MFENIPAELRNYPQWVVADMSPHPVTGRPMKRPLNPRTGEPADVTRPQTWGTFAEVLSTGSPYIGFVITDNDPYTALDLDNKEHDPATEEELQRHYKILNAFDSYTERSVSGTGFHILVRGKVPHGMDRSHVGVYPNLRYILLTGDVVRNSPINDCQNLLTVMFEEMSQQVKRVELVDAPEILTDGALIEMACDAKNGQKFMSLCRGEIDDYPSHSEADFALLSMLAFYTRNNEQVMRIFKTTELGKRAKVVKRKQYLENNLRKIRGNEIPLIDFDEVKKAADAILNPKKPEVQNSVIPKPPGIVGALAEYFFASAIRPVWEVALSAALALVAGTIGRSYNISGSGLNHYLILLARTGSGKEGALSGIEHLIASIRPSIPMADQFLGPAAFASGQALVKVLNDRPCFVSVLGEFGLTLQQLSDHRANGAQVMLRKVLLDLYAKSGWMRTLRPSVYSDTDKNTKTIFSPNVTILGESTPETFFDGLNASHIVEGLIPRFSIIEYTGDRPPRNRNANFAPSPELSKSFCDLMVIALTTTNNNTCCPVQVDPEGLALLDSFDELADRIMNKSKQEVETQLWNRAHLKALKLAALLAVGVDPNRPVITVETAQWAIDFVKRDVAVVSKRFEEGDVGQGDSKQMHDLKRVARAYFETPTAQITSHVVWMRMREKGIIPYTWLCSRTGNIASFRNDRIGATFALKRAVQTLIDSGMLSEVQRATLQKEFAFSGIAYAVKGDW